jgi:hypothetical protein
VCANTGFFATSTKCFRGGVNLLIFLHMAATTNSRGDSDHSAIELASVTMHDEMKVQRYFWLGVRFLAAAVVIFVAASAVSSASRATSTVVYSSLRTPRVQMHCWIPYTYIRRSETSARACHCTNENPLGLVDQAKAWGWSELAEDPGREIVFGAVTQPWAPLLSSGRWRLASLRNFKSRVS